jgi:hypothetical protein
MFQYILANLLADNADCLGVLFLDATGETVEMSCSDASPYEMRLLGAYLGIQLRQLDKVLTHNQLGEPLLVHIEKRSTHVFAVPLSEGYYLAMVQRQPALVARSRATLEEAARQVERELFPDAAAAADRRGYHVGHGSTP